MATNNTTEVNQETLCQLQADQKKLETNQIANAAAISALNKYHEFEEGVFAFTADSGEPNASQTAMAAVIDSIDPDHVLLGGGNAYSGDTIANNLAWVQARIDDSQVWPAWGVPDYTDFTLTDVTAFFPYLSTTFGTNRYYNQYFEKGNLEIFVINTQAAEPNGIIVDSTQYTHIANAIAASTARRKVAIFYHPPFSPIDGAADTTEYSSSLKAWYPILKACDLVLTGQNLAGWAASWGTTTVINASGSTQTLGTLSGTSVLSGADAGEAGTIWTDATNRHFLKLISSKNGLKVEAIRHQTNPGATPLIDFTITIP